MKDFLKFPKTKMVLAILCGILVVLIAFGLGIAIGYRRAIFVSRFGENYYHNFYGGPLPDGSVVLAPPPPFNTHGVVGEVIDVGSSTIAVKDPHGDEQSVVIDANTAIREMNDYIPISAIQVGNSVTIIGEPNDSGQVEARFIRVFESSSTTQ